MEIKQGVGHFIVQCDGRFNDGYNVKGHNGQEIVRDARYNDYDNAWKQGKVIASPKEYPVPEGAILYFDHTITKKGQFAEDFCINEEKGLFRVPYFKEGLNCLAYAYSVDEEVFAINEWLFVEPVKEELETTPSGLVIVDNIEDKFYLSGEQKPKEMFGKVAFFSNYYDNWGFQKGDTLVIKKGHEYEFNILGKTYYRVWPNFILAKAS